MFNLWVCKKCFKAKPWWRMARIYFFGYICDYHERIHLCKSCYAGMIVYPKNEQLKEYR